MSKPSINAYIDNNRLDPDFAADRLTFKLVGALNQRMEELDFTQAQLAERMGVSQARVSKALNFSGNATIHTLARIASALGCEWAGFKLATVDNIAPACEETKITKHKINTNGSKKYVQEIENVPSAIAV